ncbi:hypothetical protein CBM2586_B130591 [Cupriavidus phytorum]|uniref:Uncharacterized protein n=1 Tax=Cupriavidus taiwanensis TaxID=164546 RepID=A0A375CJ02_9BURK|nr:hypothetical protein CBM2586_B130591 [Cupriavidus taiwanensis]
MHASDNFCMVCAITRAAAEHHCSSCYLHMPYESFGLRERAGLANCGRGFCSFGAQGRLCCHN